MPLGSQVTTILTPSAVHHSDWAGDLSKVTGEDLNFAIADTVGQAGYVEFTDLPADVHSISSIQVYLINHLISGASLGKTDTAVLRTAITNDGGTIYNSYVEDTTIRTGSPRDSSLTKRLTSDGSAAWTISEVNGIEVHLSAHSGTVGDGIQLDHVYIEVTYITPPPPSYDSTIGKVIMDSGTTILNEGTIILD